MSKLTLKPRDGEGGARCPSLGPGLAFTLEVPFMHEQSAEQTFNKGDAEEGALGGVDLAGSSFASSLAIFRGRNPA